MISSGDSMIDVATELKKRKAGRIFVCSTFGLFTNGLKKFDDAVASGLITKVITTNLVYQTPELLSKPYYVNADMSKYIALLIDTLNHDASISSYLSPVDRINKFLERYRNGEFKK
jgi:ribose-phosphate pyrophosphokinase